MDDKVIETRVAKNGDSIRRRRVCVDCQFRFTTYETVMAAELIVVKRDDTREDFNVEKIRQGIQRACWKRPIGAEQIDESVREVVQRVEGLQQREVKSRKIGRFVMDVLRGLDEVAYVRFASVYRRFRDIDQFIAEIKDMGPRND
jgi:transcriptional repressor NrdR